MRTESELAREILHSLNSPMDEDLVAKPRLL
jgi:hypothetical protein